MCWRSIALQIVQALWHMELSVWTLDCRLAFRRTISDSPSPMLEAPDWWNRRRLHHHNHI
jgi:hypothetical protein